MIFGKIISWLSGTPGTKPLPDVLWQETLDRFSFLDRLTPHEKSRLKQLTETFLFEKEFTSAGGLELTDLMCVSIAVQGCLPVLELGLDSYRGWVGIIIYPDEFVIERTEEDEFGVVHEYKDVASGEAWDGGPLIISWHDALMAGEGYNVVIHEFAHKLDMLNGPVDGIPPLPPGISRQQWETTLHAAYDDFCARLGKTGIRDEDIPFDPYAAESPGEFFAVMSETFFETPEILHEEYPAFYAQLSRYYRQDPATRPGAPETRRENTTSMGL